MTDDTIQPDVPLVALYDYQWLTASRRNWLESVLIPWCRTSSAADLRRAEAEWPDIAGRVAPEATLWIWAWSRFPSLVNLEMGRFDEAIEVRLTLRDGSQHTGSPDDRQSRREWLVLMSREGQGGPFKIDEVATVDPLMEIRPVANRPLTPTELDSL